MPRKSVRVRIAVVFVSLALVAFAAIKFVSYAQKRSAPSVGPSVTATETLTDPSGLGTNNGDGKAQPGETLLATVTITNNGSDATAVSLSDSPANPLSPNGANGTAALGVIAANDTYSTIGNTGMLIPTGAGSVLSNDVNPSGAGTLAVSKFGFTSGTAGANNAGTTQTSPNNSSVKLDADGTLTYTPGVSFTGSEDIFYTLTNGVAGTPTSVGKITVTVSGKIWYINNGATACTTLTVASQCGTTAKPFTSLASFQAVNDGAAGPPAHPAAGDTIFIYESGAGYTGPVTLLTNQKLIGQDATSSLLSITGYSAPSGTSQVPVMNPGAGNLATINSSATNGVNLGSGNTIRGLTISGTTGAKIGGSSFGTAVLGNSASPDLTLSGTGQALNLVTGTLSTAGGFASVVSTSSTAQGINISGVADSDGPGGAAFSFGSTTISGSTSQGILVGTTTADLNFGNTAVGTASAGTGGTNSISLQNNSAGTRTFGTLTLQNNNGPANPMFLMAVGGGNVTAGTTTLSGVSGTGAAIDIESQTAGMTASFGTTSVTMAGPGGCANLGGAATGNAGPVTFNSLACTNTSGPGIIGLNNTGTITVTNATGAVSSTSGSAAVSITGASTASRTPLNLNFSGVTASGGTNGIILTNTSGTFAGGTGGISGVTGASISGTGNIATITYNGTLSKTSSGSVVAFTTQSAGTVTLGGGITCNTSCTGISLTTNTGGTITFTGGMNLSTGSNNAFTATGGGTVNATQNNTTILNQITTSTGIAVNVQNTTIGASGMTFRSITAGNGTSAGAGPATGILLNNTGSGAFTVSGDGSTAGSGGTIKNATGANAATNIPAASENAGSGIFLYSAQNISLSWMQLNDHQNYAVYGNNVTNFTLAHSVINGSNGNNDTVDEGSVAFDNLLGTASITNSSISGGWEDNLRLRNTTGTLNRLTMDTDTIGANSATFGNAALNMAVQPPSGTATMNVTVNNCTFTGSRSHFVQFLQNNGSSPTADFVFTGNTITQSMTPISGAGGVFVSEATNETSTLTFNIANNIIHSGTQQITGGDINVAHFGASSYNGKITGNTIGTTGVANSGSSQGNGISYEHYGDGSSTVSITSNTVRRYNNNGIEIDVGDEVSVPGAVNLTVTGNTVAEPDSIALHGLYLNWGLESTPVNDAMSICAQVGGAAALKNTLTNAGVAANGGLDLYSHERFHVTTKYPGYAGATNDNTAVGTYLNGQNTMSANFLVTNNVSAGGGGYIGGASCTLPAFPTLGAPDVGATAELQQIQELGTQNAEIALAEPVQNVLGDMGQAEVIAVPRQATTEDKPSLIAELYDKLTSNIEPTVEAQSGPASGSITTTPTFTLPAGSSVTITYQLTVANGPYPAGLNNLTDAASVSGSNFATVTATPTASIPLDASPSITVANTDASGETQPGTTIVYAVSATNANIINGQDATGVVLTQTVPTNTTFNAAASAAGWTGCVNGSPGGTVCTNTIGALSANGTPVTKNFAVDVPGPLAATVTSIGDTGSVADDGTNGANQGAPTSQLDTDTVRGTWTGGTSTDFATATNWVNNLLPNPGQNISIPSGGGANAPTLGSGTVVTNSVFFSGKDLTISAGANLTANTSVSLVTNKVLGAGTLELGNGATITRTTGQVNCALKKNFLNGAIPPPAGATDGAEATTAEATTADANAPDAPQAVFTFPVGTAAGYFPVDVTPTAGSTGNLTIQTFDGTAGVVPPLDNTKTLQRYWTLTGGAGITASLKFFYNATTVNGNEANYKPTRVTGGTATSFADNCPAGTCVDETNNFIFMPSVSTFAGNWTASELAPTAAMVGVSGRVLSADGRAVRGVRVTLDDGTGHPMTVISNAFGYYHFDEVQSGGTYILGATARGYTFTPRVVSVTDELTSVDLTALP